MSLLLLQDGIVWLIDVVGNLCRCTGYRPILEGFSSFTKSACPMGAKCCKNGGSGCDDNSQSDGGGETELRYDPSQEPIFPPELKVTLGCSKQGV